jgi:hypothetical protein
MGAFITWNVFLNNLNVKFWYNFVKSCKLYYKEKGGAHNIKNHSFFIIDILGESKDALVKL